jgi:hypothetical protein
MSAPASTGTASTGTEGPAYSLGPDEVVAAARSDAVAGLIGKSPEGAAADPFEAAG